MSLGTCFSVAAVYAWSILAPPKTLIMRTKRQYQLADAFYLIVLCSVSLGIATHLLAWYDTEGFGGGYWPNWAARILSVWTWMVAGVVSPIIWFAAIRALGSAGVWRNSKRAIFICIIAPLTVLFSVLLAISLFLLIRELIRDLTTPTWITYLVPTCAIALFVWPLLKTASKWCFTPNIAT